MYRATKLAATAAVTLSLVGALAPEATAQRPSIVQIQHQTSPGTWSYVATGVLVDSTWVLAPAHVVDGTPASMVRVVAGGGPDMCDITSMQTVSVLAWTTPDDPSSVCGNGYNPVDYTNDIALLNLAVPISYGPNVGPANLAIPGTLLKAGDTVTVEGRWQDGACTGPVGCDRKSIDLDIVSTVDLDAALGAFSLTSTACQFGAIDPLLTDAPWNGGTGAGAFMKIGSVDTLVGIRSYYISSGGCIDPTEPGVFTRISEYSTWIATITGNPAPPVNLGGSGVPVGTTCGSMALQGIGGLPMLGNTFFELEVSGMPSNSPGLVGMIINIGSSTSILPWNGGSLHASAGGFFWHWDGFKVVAPVTGDCNGLARFPFPIPAAPGGTPLVGVKLTPQAIYISGTSPYPMTTTNAMTFTIM